jgi:hypothetical protein
MEGGRSAVKSGGSGMDRKRRRGVANNGEGNSIGGLNRRANNKLTRMEKTPFYPHSGGGWGWWGSFRLTGRKNTLKGLQKGLRRRRKGKGERRAGAVRRGKKGSGEEEEEGKGGPPT